MASLKQNIVRHKIGLLNLAVELDKVSKACMMIGFSRPSITANCGRRWHLNANR